MLQCGGCMWDIHHFPQDFAVEVFAVEVLTAPYSFHSVKFQCNGSIPFRHPHSLAPLQGTPQPLRSQPRHTMAHDFLPVHVGLCVFCPMTKPTRATLP